jgi:hypothetical protein
MPQTLSAVANRNIRLLLPRNCDVDAIMRDVAEQLGLYAALVENERAVFPTRVEVANEIEAIAHSARQLHRQLSEVSLTAAVKLRPRLGLSERRKLIDSLTSLQAFAHRLERNLRQSVKPGPVRDQPRRELAAGLIKIYPGPATYSRGSGCHNFVEAVFHAGRVGSGGIERLLRDLVAQRPR